MTTLTNKLRFTPVYALLICFIVNSTAMANNRCGTGTIERLVYNESENFDYINKVNNLRFKLSDNSEYWINNDGGIANNKIFGTLEMAVSSAYLGNRVIEVWTKDTLTTCTGAKTQNDLLIVFPNPSTTQ